MTKTGYITVANLILISKLPKFNVFLMCQEINSEQEMPGSCLDFQIIPSFFFPQPGCHKCTLSALLTSKQKEGRKQLNSWTTFGDTA